MRREATDWGKIGANRIPDKGLVSIIYEELLQLNNNFKNGQKIWVDISPEDMWLHMKRSSISAVIREMQIYNDTVIPTRNDCNQKDNTKCW